MSEDTNFLDHDEAQNRHKGDFGRGRRGNQQEQEPGNRDRSRPKSRGKSPNRDRSNEPKGSNRDPNHDKMEEQKSDNNSNKPPISEDQEKGPHDDKNLNDQKGNDGKNEEQKSDNRDNNQDGQNDKSGEKGQKENNNKNEEQKSDNNSNKPSDREDQGKGPHNDKNLDDQDDRDERDDKPPRNNDSDGRSDRGDRSDDPDDCRSDWSGPDGDQHPELDNQSGGGPPPPPGGHHHGHGPDGLGPSEAASYRPGFMERLSRQGESNETVFEIFLGSALILFAVVFGAIYLIKRHHLKKLGRSQTPIKRTNLAMPTQNIATANFLQYHQKESQGVEFVYQSRPYFDYNSQKSNDKLRLQSIAKFPTQEDVLDLS